MVVLLPAAAMPSCLLKAMHPPLPTLPFSPPPPPPACSPETLAKMAAGQQRRRQRERTARGEDAVGGPAAGLPAAPPAPQLNEALARERAVIELSRLRQEVFAWMRAFEEQHGRKPTLPETADINPPIYQKFVRFMALRDALRASDIKA